MKNKLSSKNIVLGVTGSIAAYKACELVSRLKEEGYTVYVIMTGPATKFITPLTLMTLSGNRVYTEMFSETDHKPGHVSLADRAGIILIAPATADIIAKMACGIADDLLTSTVLSTKAPVLVAPAMHRAMYENRVTAENIKRLKKRGVMFINPEYGRLASGDTGKGRLAKVARIIEEVRKFAGKKNS